MNKRVWNIGEIRDVMGALLSLPGMKREYGSGMHILADTLQSMEEAGWKDGDDVLETLLQAWQGQGYFAKKGRKDIRKILELRKQMSGENRFVV